LFLQGTKHADPKLFFKNKEPTKMSQDPEKETRKKNEERESTESSPGKKRGTVPFEILLEF